MSEATDMRSARDRRDSARTRVFVLVHAGREEEPMWAWDIAMGGMQCRSNTPRWPGTYLDLRFRLPDSEEMLEVGAQVMTLEPAAGGQVSLGMSFRALSPKAQRELYRFLDRRRQMWNEERRFAASKNAVAEDGAGPAARPFEALLSDAYASLRAKELLRPGFFRALEAQAA